MSKSSKSCGYTGHMKTMNRVNETKIDYESNRSKSHQSLQIAAEQRAQAHCGCKETSFKIFKAR
jgi:Fe-S cluster assembly iron-binding protein IscA